MSMSPREINMAVQLQKIGSLLTDVGVPKAVSFLEDPHKIRTDLPGRVEWALLACATAPNERALRDAIWQELQVELQKGGYGPETTPTLWEGFRQAVERAQPQSTAMADPDGEHTQY